jgi:hypothetical protein
MWEIIAAILIVIALFLSVRLRLSKKKNDDAVQEVFVCPSCGLKHCDCYKHTR